MLIGRRAALGMSAALGATLSGCAQAGHGSDDEALRHRILAGLRGLPGTMAIKIWSPATATRPAFLLSENAGQRLFVGSAIKAFVLCERLRQLDGPDILEKLTATDTTGAVVPGEFLTLDRSVWTADSATFNPPYLSGQVTERTAMEAMILHSDNTATDMELKQAGPDRVRAFLAAAGLRSSAVPDSTRSFFGYLLGAPDYRTFSWAELLAASKSDAPIRNSPLNDVETLASSADDLVTFYTKALSGGYFRDAATLRQFRNLLSLGDVINLVPFPLGISAFAKGGSIDVPGAHALCIPGGLKAGSRWIYFAAILNWAAPGPSDPATADRFVAAVRDALQLALDRLT